MSEKYSWINDWELNHSGDILEDMLGNNKEMTLALRESMKKDAKSRFKYTMIIGVLLGIIGISFLFVRFIPTIISLWMFGMTVGMFLAGLFGMLFSMPVTDSVSVHLKVINYVDNVIRNQDWKPNNLMDGSITAEELIERESEKEPEEDNVEEDEESEYDERD